MTVDAPFALSYGFVAPATRADGSPCVLKLAVRGAGAEAAALRAFAGEGAVRLLADDAGDGALLLERALPGDSLAGLAGAARDDEATTVAAGVMARLWREPPPGHAFTRVAEYGADLDRARPHGPLTAALLDRARAGFAELVATTGEERLLHGDLHHANLLAARREPWLAIDPAQSIRRRPRPRRVDEAAGAPAGRGAGPRRRPHHRLGVRRGRAVGGLERRGPRPPRRRRARGGGRAQRALSPACRTIFAAGAAVSPPAPWPTSRTATATRGRDAGA